jgi:hypothetical protein
LIGSSKEPRRIHPKFHIKSKQRNPVAPKASGVIMYLNLFCVSASGSATDDSDGRSTQRFCQVVRHRQQSRGRCMPEIEAELTDVDRSIMAQTIELYSFQVHQGSGAIRRLGVMYFRIFHRHLFSLISYQVSAISGDT